MNEELQEIPINWKKERTRKGVAPQKKTKEIRLQRNVRRLEYHTKQPTKQKPKTLDKTQQPNQKKKKTQTPTKKKKKKKNKKKKKKKTKKHKTGNKQCGTER